MGSLFDLAAELSQYDEPQGLALTAPQVQATGKPAHIAGAGELVTRTPSNQDGDTALSLLDETLLAIYATRQPPRPTQAPPPTQVTPVLTAQRSAPQLLPDRSSASDDRGQRPRSTTPTITSTPLQSVFAQSLAVAPAASTRAIPPPPSAPPPRDLRSPVPSGGAVKAPPVVSHGAEDPDVAAKKVLRDVQEELEQLPRDAMASPRRCTRLQRSLSDKYLQGRLNHLPPTPFVQLARKKTQQKIDQLNTRQLHPAAAQPETPAPPTRATTPNSPGIFPPDQHEMLVKLARIPENHIAKLSGAQQQTVQFAKRYDKILRLSSDELRKLPVSQAQLLQQLRQQLKQ